jgi:hypothetical protein
MKYEELKSNIQSRTREDLEADILNATYNDFINELADYKDGENDLHGHGKRVPYIGWFWRRLDFYNAKIPVGDCGEFKGFIRNNKWGYEQRNLTQGEFENVVSIIDEARFLSVEEERNAKIDELWDYVQSLEIGASDNEI